MKKNVQKERMNVIKFIAFFLITMVFVGCKSKTLEDITISGLKKSDFQKTIDGKKTDLYVLTNNNGMEVAITNYGGVIVSVVVPDKNDAMKDVVLGFDNIDDYINIENNFGATIGRYGNRIAKGKIIVDNVEYNLPKNNFGHTLHGGEKGFNTKVFNANQIDNQTLELTYLSVDNEEGFPGNLSVKVIMELTNDNTINIKYEATTDKETICNLTNHSYFNLSGNPHNTILEDVLMINADNYTPIDDTFMTTGEISSVVGTPMDFRTPALIGARIHKDFEQLVNGKGYDHNWVLNTKGDVSKLAASVFSPQTGIKMEVYTSEPGLQVYVGNFLDGTVVGKNKVAYGHRTAICLESQKYPDSPNKPQWPSPLLKPNEIYTSRCIYKFKVKN